MLSLGCGVDNLTVFHIAAIKGYRKIIKLFIDFDVTTALQYLNLKCGNGFTVYKYAICNNHRYLAEYIKFVKDELSTTRLTMTIWPNIKFRQTNFKDRPDANGLILTTLKGCEFLNNQVEIVSKDSNSIIVGNYVYDDISYSPDQLNTALMTGQMNICPFHYIKRFTYINQNTELIIKKVENGRFININLSNTIKDKFLLYMQTDCYEWDNQCWELVKETVFDKLNVKFTGPVSDQIIMMTDQKLLTSGDAIVLLSEESETTIKIRHYAIFLDNDIYLSKFGNSGHRYISDLESMMAFWKCNRFAKINLEIANINTFSTNPFPVLNV